MSEIQCKVSLGELVDKISILMIKVEKIGDPSKHKNIKNELAILEDVLAGLNINGINTYLTSLKEINLKLWDIEDRIRLKESAKDFTFDFIDLARAVYHTNDQRFAIKNAINEKFGSTLREVKKLYEHQKIL